MRNCDSTLALRLTWNCWRSRTAWPSRSAFREGKGAWTDILSIKVSRLTLKGEEYVRQARTPQWRQACEKLNRSGTPATTERLMRELRVGLLRQDMQAS